MFRKTLLATFVAVAAGVVAMEIYRRKKDTEESTEDSVVNFIDLNDEEEEDLIEAPTQFISRKESQDQEFSKEVNEIVALYPYLEKKFIAEQFVRNEVFSSEYPVNSVIQVKHKALFEDREVLESFLMISKENGYDVCALSEVEGEVSHTLQVVEGALLSDIYNVANQVACLHGKYEGYLVTVEE